MNWPQIVILCWISVEIGASIALHGTLRKRPISGPASVITYVFFGWVLYAGGFWK